MTDAPGVPRVRILSETPERAVFEFAHVDAALMNVIRHALYADVPILAPNTVTFIQYDGPLEPELISHMVGQLPLRFCDREDPSLTTAEFAIDVRTDSAVPKLTWVKSTDVTCTSTCTSTSTSESKHVLAEVVHFRSDAERAAATHDVGFLLCPLHAGQRFVATFTATVATGRHGTRWNAVHPTVRPDEGTPGTYFVTVQTTGAIAPKKALEAALSAVLQRVRVCSDAL